jgi:hypothetical protein
MNFYLAEYDLAFNAEIWNLGPGALFFCSYGRRVELKRNDSAKERVAIKKKTVCVFFPPLPSTHSSNTNSIAAVV